MYLANIISVRDNDSKQNLEKIGLKNKEIYVTSDPAVLLNSRNIGKYLMSEDIFVKEGIIRKGKLLIGFSIRSLPHYSLITPNGKLKEDSIFLNLSRILAYLSLQLEADIVFLPFQLRYDSDLTIIERLIKQTELPNIYCLRNQYHPSEILSIISKMDFIIGMRLHSLIFAGINSIPMIGIDYDPKVRYWMRSLDIEEFCCSLDDLDIYETKKKFALLLNNYSRLRNRIKESIDVLQRKAKEGQLLLSSLDK